MWGSTLIGRAQVCHIRDHITQQISHKSVICLGAGACERVKERQTDKQSNRVKVGSDGRDRLEGACVELDG